MIKWNRNFKLKSRVLLKTSILLYVIYAVGCGEPPTVQDIQVTAVFSAAPMAETASTVSLTISDVNGKILPDKSQNLTIAENTASGTVTLEAGEYIFDVKVLDKNDYLIGWGYKKVTVSQDMSESISITILTLPPIARNVTLKVTFVEVPDRCQSIPALFLDGAVPVYADAGTKTLNSYFPSGWMGDTKDIKYEDADTTNPCSGETCARITYSATGAQGWAGMYWLPIPKVRDDWGNIVFGIDLTGVKKLRWCAKGANGGERVEFFTGSDIKTACSDSLPKKTTQPNTVTLTTNWQSLEIDLSSVPSNQLTRVVGGFGWAANRDNNPGGITFYIDEVKFLK